MREKRDLYDKYCNLTGNTYYKGDSCPKDSYPMVVMIALQNSKGEFLMQERSLEKGGGYGVTGGHPKAGESPEQGIISEVREELGLDISDCKLEPFCLGCDGVDCYKMFYLNIDIDINKLTLQKEEVASVRWFSEEKLYQMTKDKELNVNQIDFFTKCMSYLKHNKKYFIKHQFPTNSEYIELFNSVDWERESCKVDKVRENTCFAVSIYEQDKIVAMGRVVGDGCYFTIYDIVTRADKQRQGLGSMVMSEIINWYKCIKDDDSFLYLGASKGKEGFYERFGFKSRPNQDIGAGMKWYED